LKPLGKLIGRMKMTSELLTLTERQIREKEFYEEYVAAFDSDHEVDLSPVKAKKKRPWNSYWEMYHIATREFKNESRMLDFGSGPGDNALRFSEIGYQICGFDICESNVVMSRRIFEKYARSDRADFIVATAENLPYPDSHFDFIAGIDILHHVDIGKSLKECKRVLKPGGVAIFREPLEVTFLDAIRNTVIVKWISPKGKSLDLHITEDERKLNSADLQTIRYVFPDITIRKYFLLARFDKFFRKGSDPHPSFLEQVDSFLMKYIPFLENLGGVVIMELRK
jgi:ubiquinone/menaquinone biosynthesis C-methylase UbiE